MRNVLESVLQNTFERLKDFIKISNSISEKLLLPMNFYDHSFMELTSFHC